MNRSTMGRPTAAETTQFLALPTNRVQPIWVSYVRRDSPDHHANPARRFRYDGSFGPIFASQDSAGPWRLTGELVPEITLNERELAVDGLRIPTEQERRFLSTSATRPIVFSISGRSYSAHGIRRGLFRPSCIALRRDDLGGALVAVGFRCNLGAALFNRVPQPGQLATWADPLDSVLIAGAIVGWVQRLLPVEGM